MILFKGVFFLYISRLLYLQYPKNISRYELY